MADPNAPSTFEKYRLGQCNTLAKLDAMLGAQSIQDVSDVYGDLNVLARIFYCSGKAIGSKTMIREGLTDSIQYDELSKLWSR